MNLPLPKVEICLSPALLHLYNLKGKIVVIIDIFRATSTMVTALYNGATTVIPVEQVEECISIGNSLQNSITAGERDGKIADGLEYGNSPMSFPKDFIDKKTLVLTTTNGTKVLHMTHDAEIQIIGSFLNLSAVVDFIKKQNKSVILACAAWKDRVNLEDSLFAGAVVHMLSDSFEIYCDSSRMCRILYQDCITDYTSIINFLKQSTHYKRLSQYNLEDDMAYCAQVDIHPIVPIYKDNQLVIAQPY